MSANVKICYFSPTHSAERIAQAVGKGFSEQSGKGSEEYNLTLPKGRKNWRANTSKMASDEVLVVGFPVYAGRIPQVFAEELGSFEGSGTPAIIVAAYGNRACDDALLEASDILSAQGFYVAGVVTAPCQHSFTEQVAVGRPNSDDLKEAFGFGRKLAEKLASGSSDPVEVRGNKPYAPHPPVDFRPLAKSDLCISCLACVEVCPVAAIDADDPSKTDTVCVGCGACIKACSDSARYYNPEIIGPLITMLETHCADTKQAELML